MINKTTRLPRTSPDHRMHQIMPSNVEIKARLSDKQRVITVAKELSGTEGILLEQADTFYHVSHGRLKLRVLGNSNCGELISYSRPDKAGPKLSNFSKVTVQNAAEMNVVLSESLGILGEVKKNRMLFIVGQTRIHIDSVKNLGYFLELEVMMKDGQSLLEGQSIATDLMTKLGVEEKDLITVAYMDMLLKNFSV